GPRPARPLTSWRPPSSRRRRSTRPRSWRSSAPSASGPRRTARPPPRPEPPPAAGLLAHCRSPGLARTRIPPDVTAEPDGIDTGRIEKAVREILEAIGEEPDRDGLLNTPERVANMYAEIFSGVQD